MAATARTTMSTREVEACRQQADALLAEIFRRPLGPAPVQTAPRFNRPAPAAARELVLA